MGGGKSVQMREKRMARLTARKVEKVSMIERKKEKTSALTSLRERFFPPFFPRRVITSLSVRQLRRKKSSNNHIYGAAASLRCIDPRRWPGEGRKERKEPARRSSEAGREREGRDEEEPDKKSVDVLLESKCCALRRAAPQHAQAEIFLVDVQEPFHKIERITVLATRNSTLPAH